MWYKSLDHMQHGEGALHIAAGYGRLEIVKELLVFGAHLDMPDKVSKIIISFLLRMLSFINELIILCAQLTCISTPLPLFIQYLLCII